MSDTPRGPDWWQAADGRWYPPPAPPPPSTPPPGSAPPPAQRSGMSGCLKAFLIVLAVGAVLGLGSCVALAVLVDDAAEDVEEQLAEEEEREARDLGDVSCTVDDAGFMVADIPVTNNSSERSNYSIEVTFEGADGSQLDTGLAPVESLEPGQSTTARAQTLTEPPPDGQFDCRVVEVDRFSDEP